jgi:hypothetical protein
MSFRRRHRWTRRTLIGLAFAVMAAPASALPLETAGSELGLPPQDTTLTSPSVLGEAVKSQTSAPVVPDVIERAVATHLRTVDPVTGIPASAGIPLPGDAFIVDPTTARPDDRADRFVVGDGTPAPVTVADDGFALDWEHGVTVGLGGLAIVLAIALALSYMRRPRIAL